MIYNRLGVINMSNGKHFKKDRWRILACGTASNESVGLVYVTRWKKCVESFLIDEKSYEVAAALA